MISNYSEYSAIHLVDVIGRVCDVLFISSFLFASLFFLPMILCFACLYILLLSLSLTEPMPTSPDEVSTPESEHPPLLKQRSNTATADTNAIDSSTLQSRPRPLVKRNTGTGPITCHHHHHHHMTSWFISSYRGQCNMRYMYQSQDL